MNTHTHTHKSKHRYLVGHQHTACTIHITPFAMPWLFYYRLYCSLCTQPETFCGPIRQLNTGHLMAPQPTVETAIPLWSEINDPLGLFHQSTSFCISLSLPFVGRKKGRKSLCHHAYLQIWMHSNSYPELPKLRITQFWIRGERKIIHERPL